MRPFCFALLVIIVAFTSSEAKATKDKRVVDLGGLLGGLLGGSNGGLLSSVLGGNGATGNLLGGDNLLGLDSTLNNVLGGVTNLLERVVGQVLLLVKNLTSSLTNVLQGVDLNDANAVLSAFDDIPCNELCVACGVQPENRLQQACREYCANTCRWVF